MFPQFANPRSARRIAVGVLVLGGTLAGLGTLIRSQDSAGNDQWTYLLDTAGLGIVIAGAALDVRVSARFAEFDAGGTRRRAIWQFAFGAMAAVTGCIVLGWVASGSWPALARAFLSGLLTLGIGLGLAGLMYIGWFSGGDYLERRIGQRADEEW